MNTNRNFALLTFVSLGFIFVVFMTLQLKHTHQTQQHPRRRQAEVHVSEEEDDGDQNDEGEDNKDTEQHGDDNSEEEDNDHTSDSVCRDVFEIQKTSTNMTEWMTNVVTFIWERKKKKQFIPSLYYELMGLESPAMTAIVNDSSGYLGSNVTIAKVRPSGCSF